MGELARESDPSRTYAEKVAVEVTAVVSTLVSALRMIEQGYVFRGSERVPLDAEGMRAVARLALEPPDA